MPLDDKTMAPDDVLLRAYARGEGRAAEILTARLLPRVYAHALRLLGDVTEAEDVAQEAMMRLWRTAPAWRAGEAKVTTWLYRVTANLCIDRLRRRRQVPLDGIDEPADARPIAAAQMQQRSRLAALQHGLNALPDRQRQAIVLRHMEGLSNTRIAEIMDIGPRAVESLIARGKRALVAHFAGRREELGYEDDTD